MAKIGNNLNVSLNQFENWANQAINAGKDGGDRLVKVERRPSLPVKKNLPVGKTTLATKTILPAKTTATTNGIVCWNRSKNITKADNNTARASLLNMVRKELGLNADTPIKSFPASVQKAMNYGFLAKLFNYFNDWSADNGRPLSARNIKAITDAVKVEKEKKAAVDNLAKLGPEVEAVVKGDKELQEALRNNTKGAAQLCEALRKFSVAKDAFINNEGFRAAIVQNLKDGCRCPLPVGELSFTSTGRSDEFAEVKKSVDALFNSGFSNTERPGKYAGMLHQCGIDYARQSFLIKVDGQEFDLLEGVEVNGRDVSNTEANKKQMEANVKKLLAKLDLPDTQATRMQMMEFITQGSTTATTFGPGNCSRFSLPKGQIGRGNRPLTKPGEICTYSFTTKGGLKCNLKTQTRVRNIVSGSNGVLLYDDAKSTFETSLSVGLGIGKGSGKYPEKLTVKSIGVPPNERTSKFNLVLDESSYL